MTAKINLRINHEHIARVMAERRARGIGESFHTLTWFRQRDTQGRFRRIEA